MSSVGVAELKARLSEFLRAVRKGNEIVVMDRDQPVARLTPYEARGALRVREPTTAYATLGDIPLPPPRATPSALPVDPVELLIQDREGHR